MDRTLRTGIFGVVLVASLVLVSFSYTAIPFWPQGKNYVAYFTDASGISPGSDVQISGIKVGKVGSVALAGPTPGSISPSTASCASATSRWRRSKPRPCSGRRHWRSPPPAPAR